MRSRIATVFGGTGFIGAQIVQALAAAGWTVKVAARVPERAFALRPCGTPGQVVPLACDHGNPESVAQALRGADVAVNAIGILYARGKATFPAIHTDLPARIAAACAVEEVKRFVHISALGITGRSRYAASKRDGEQAVLQAFPDATILRPSVVFGPGDSFFTFFAECARMLPALPLIGGGHTRMQPVYAGDVVAAVMAALTLPATGGAADPRGRTYELGGPEILTFREIYERLFACTGRRRALVPLPWGVARAEAALLSLLPHPLLTPDQVETLKTDSVTAPDAPGLAALGLRPTGMDLILPTYLAAYRPGRTAGAGAGI